MKKYLDFSQEFGKVDEELIAEAGKPWTIKRGDISGCTGENRSGSSNPFGFYHSGW